MKYWEFWNEPDLSQIFWRGTPDQFYALYKTVAIAVKSADANALVGGPTIALPNNPNQPYREGFLAYVRDQKLPLDFFSWHWYSIANDPYDFVSISKEIRRLLDRYGFQSTKSILDEWNADITRGPAAGGPEQTAAFATTARIYMQDAPIDIDAYYRADSVFGFDGKKPTKVGQAFNAMGKMADTPMRLNVSGGDVQGFGVEGGESADGDLIQILISNYQVPEADRGSRQGPDSMSIPGIITLVMPSRRAFDYSKSHGYDLTIKGLARYHTYLVERYVMSSTEDFHLAQTMKIMGSAPHVANSMDPQSIELLIIKKLK